MSRKIHIPTPETAQLKKHRVVAICGLGAPKLFSRNGTAATCKACLNEFLQRGYDFAPNDKEDGDESET